MTAQTSPSEGAHLSRHTVRYVGAAAATVTAVLYLLVGFEVLPVGEPTSGGPSDLLAFGLMAGGTFAVAAVALLLRDSRILSAAVAIWSLVTIVGYFAFAGLREPPFEIWGLAIKAGQVFVFGAAAYLAMRRPAHAHANG